MRNITAAIEAEKDKASIIPIELYQIFLPDTTLYLATWTHQIAFYNEAGEPEIYMPAALSRRPINRSKTLEVDRFEVSLDNVGQDWSGTAANYELQGVKVNVWKVFLERIQKQESFSSESWNNALNASLTWNENGILSDQWKAIADISFRNYYVYEAIGNYNDYVPLFSGEIDRPNLNKENITVEVVSKLNVLDKQAPGRRFGGRCPWVFGGEECGVDAPANAGTIQAVDGTGTVITVENLQDTNWTHGGFSAGKNKRVITGYNSTANTITVEFPVSTDITAGTSYSIKAGCSKVKGDEVEGCTFWNNTEFFGGFPAIPQIRNIRE